MTLKENAPFKRSEITGFLESNRIQTRNYFAGNIMLQPAYTHLIDVEDVINNFPVSRKVTTDTFFLGTAPVITKQQIDYISDVVEQFMKQY